MLSICLLPPRLSPNSNFLHSAIPNPSRLPSLSISFDLSLYRFCPSIAFEVEDFDSAVAGLRANNIKFTLAPFETPVCRMAIVSDPDGNSICIHKRQVR